MGLDSAAIAEELDQWLDPFFLVDHIPILAAECQILKNGCSICLTILVALLGGNQEY